jgi:hypothetical protein
VADVTIHIEGYGQISVEKPAVYNDDSFADGLSDAVAKVMTLIHPTSQKERFHPVLGLGGYESSNPGGSPRWIPNDHP